MNSPAISDNDLMLQVRDGNVALLGVLFERHHVRLFNFLVRLTNKREVSEDLVQDVFFRMLRYGHSFRGDAPFVVWMYRLARNAAADNFRKWRHELPMDDSVAQQVDDTPQPAASLEHREGSELLQKALALLAEEKREVLILSRYHDLKYEEIGAILGCPVGTVKARVHRALKDLKKEYVRLAGN